MAPRPWSSITAGASGRGPGMSRTHRSPCPGMATVRSISWRSGTGSLTAPTWPIPGCPASRGLNERRPRSPAGRGTGPRMTCGRLRCAGSEAAATSNRRAAPIGGCRKRVGSYGGVRLAPVKWFTPTPQKATGILRRFGDFPKSSYETNSCRTAAGAAADRRKWIAGWISRLPRRSPGRPRGPRPRRTRRSPRRSARTRPAGRTGPGSRRRPACGSRRSRDRPPRSSRPRPGCSAGWRR